MGMRTLPRTERDLYYATCHAKIHELLIHLLRDINPAEVAEMPREQRTLLADTLNRLPEDFVPEIVTPLLAALVEWEVAA